MIVVDASVALTALLTDGAARAYLGTEQLHAPFLIDSDIAHVMRRCVAAGQLDADDGWSALDVWRRIAVRRYPVYPLFERIWALQNDLSADDTGYVALAEVLHAPLVTCDARLSRAPGVRCAITVLPT